LGDARKWRRGGGAGVGGIFVNQVKNWFLSGPACLRTKAVGSVAGIEFSERARKSPLMSVLYHIFNVGRPDPLSHQNNIPARE